MFLAEASAAAAPPSADLANELQQRDVDTRPTTRNGGQEIYGVQGFKHGANTLRNVHRIPHLPLHGRPLQICRMPQADHLPKPRRRTAPGRHGAGGVNYFVFYLSGSRLAPAVDLLIRKRSAVQLADVLAGVRT